MDSTKMKSSSAERSVDDRLSTLTWLLSQEQLSPDKAKIVALLSQEFEILEFELGEQIMNGSEQNSQDFFLVCEGKLRLLGFDIEKQREVSISLLTEGATFGGDSFWNNTFLAYNAIAASPVCIAKISLEKLQSWLEQLPELQTKWQSESQKRQKLIFFKTLTELRSLSSIKIQKLLPFLVEKEISQGESLAQAHFETSRFWLRNGQIKDRILAVGSSWGHPNKIPHDWQAETNLEIYQLSPQNWQIFSDIAPTLVTAWSNNSQTEFNQTSPSHKRPNNIGTITSVKASSFNIDYKNKTSIPKSREPISQASTVDYPKPKKRRSGLWQSYPFIQQQSSSDCGATCLAMISQYWGKRLSINFLRELIGTGLGGASLKNLAKAADKLGYHARPVRASLSRILEQKNPWIAHWKGDHYIVVYRIRGNKILISDPAVGKLEIERSEFLTCWTGYALILDPTENLDQAPEEKRSLTKFLHLLWPYRSLGLTIILASILIQVFGLISPLFTQIILDQVVVNQSQSTLNVFVVGLLLFSLLGMAISSARSYLLSYLSNRLDLTMVSGFVKHALTLPLHFFESRRVGDIITRVQENQKIQQFLIGQIMLSWLDLVSGFIYLCLMLYYNLKLTLLVLAIVPPIVILTLIATPLLRKISRERFNAAAEQNSSLVEMFTGIATVKAVAGEQELRWRWEENLTRQLNVRFKGQKLAINLGLLSGLINSIGGTLLLWYGATLVIQGQLSIGQYVAFNMMKGHIISPIIALVGLWDELQEVLISVERLNDVFDTQPEDSTQTFPMALSRLWGEVHFDNVTFRYDSESERNALQNISFEVFPGQTLAIVGRSGSGKSTLVKLLQGLYYPTSGQVWIDGLELQHLSLQSLRSQQGVVPQECFLFSGTILENITMHRAGFSLEQVIETAKLAEAHPFIQAMPLGYNTKVGERGSNLSGGQRQRIAIARALLGTPPILILDEATSSLDTESERRFQENLARLSKDRTTFIIAHRLSTVRNADCIIVLDKGNLVEKGTHEELIAQKGIYYHLAQQQLDL